MDRKRRVFPIFIILTLAFLVSCGVLSFGGIGITDYGDDEVNIVKDEISVIITYSSPEEIVNNYALLGGTKDNVLAFSYTVEGVCRITAVKPTNWDDHRALTIIGHEIIHCQGGKHK